MTGLSSYTASCTILFFNLIPILMQLPSATEARSKCVKVVGRIHCSTDWDRHYDVDIRLMDKDSLPWENDDEMARTRTDEDGNFVLQGCADDLGSWNDPDPYLFVEHRCPAPGHTVSIPRRRKTVILGRIYQPESIYVETIRIDDDESN